jgi:hypothetical protein
MGLDSEPQPTTPDEPALEDEEAAPPFQPDPEIVTVLERGRDPTDERRVREAIRKRGDSEQDE